MQRNAFIAVAVIAVVAILLGMAIYLRDNGVRLLMHTLVPPPDPEVMYPHAPPMPAIVATPVESLLADYEKILQAKAPAVLAILQPGLSDAQIDALESKHQIKLTPDLRALYRWRNGTPRASLLNAFPDHRFEPLDEALAAREALIEEVKNQPKAQRDAFADYAGFSEPWIGLLMDGAGDGYYFDPTRTEAEGSFFFNFREDGQYVFFPAFRNYLAAVIEGCGADVFIFEAMGVQTRAFEKALNLYEKYGASNPLEAQP